MYDPRLLVIGNAVYLLTTVTMPASAGAIQTIAVVLHRYTGTQ